MIRSPETKNLTSVTMEEMPKVKEQIKSKLPLLNAREIRRYKIPYCEAVILELHEDGYHEAAEYFTFLFDLDEETRREAGPDTLIWNKPKLKDNDDLINRLRDVLTIFCQHTVSASERTTAMIQTALYFQNLSWEWWWIAETLYRSTFWMANEAREVENDGKRSLSILRFFYARFLFYQMKNGKAALEYVRKAYRDSRDKSWNAKKILGAHQESLFRECCRLLHKVLVNYAQQIRECDPGLAVDSCTVALSSATESGREEYIAEARYELGKSEIAAGDIKEGLLHFSKGLAMFDKIPDPNGTCKTISELVQAYKKINDDEKLLENIDKLKEMAIRYQLPLSIAEAHSLTGEYYLARKSPIEATPNFEEAFTLYNEYGTREEANRARVMAGISKGEEMMEAYMNLIKRSGEGRDDSLLKLILWRDRGEPFEGVSTLPQAFEAAISQESIGEEVGFGST